MIAPNSVATGIFLLCASDANLVANSGSGLTPNQPFQVGLYGPLVADPALCPWLQVHLTKHESLPYVLGRPQFQEQKFEVRVFHADASWFGSSGDVFRRVWDAEYYLTHSLFNAPGNVALSGLVAPGVTLVQQGFTSELWALDEVNEGTLVTNLLTLRLTGHG